MPDITVIIPTYNRAAVLARAVESALAQKVDFEILVIDDGSIDETKTLVETLQNDAPNLHYYYQANRGPSAARNLGIKRSRGNFVAFLDSDDEWISGKLNAQLDFFKEHPDYLICQTEEIWIRNGARVNPMKKHEKFGGEIFEKCLPLSIVSPSCAMMRREFFDAVGFFDETFPACEDYDLWLRASARFPIGLIKKPYVVKYGGHPDQRSREFPVMDQFRIRALEKLIRGNNLSPEQKKAVQKELIHKCRIVSQGAKKRGKFSEAQYYESLMNL